MLNHPLDYQPPSSEAKPLRSFASRCLLVAGFVAMGTGAIGALLAVMAVEDGGAKYVNVAFLMALLAFLGVAAVVAATLGYPRSKTSA